MPAIAPDVPAIAPAPDRIKRTPRLNARHGGYVHSARITEIVALSNSHGGMAEGVRHMTLFYYYASCRGEYACLHPGSGMAHAWAVARTVELNATFSPPLDAAEVMSAVTQSAAGPLRSGSSGLERDSPGQRQKATKRTKPSRRQIEARGSNAESGRHPGTDSQAPEVERPGHRARAGGRPKDGDQSSGTDEPNLAGHFDSPSARATGSLAGRTNRGVLDRISAP